MHLSKFGGYEVATEGDAFVIAFHTPAKAVAWAAATQQVTAARTVGRHAHSKDDSGQGSSSSGWGCAVALFGVAGPGKGRVEQIGFHAV